MANEVRTFIEVKSDNNETFTKLQEMFGGADYKTMYETDWLYHKLYGEKEYDRGVYTEEMGAKWCYVDDIDPADDSFTMTTVSAWYYCEGAIQRLQEILHGVDEEVCIAFTYEDESLAVETDFLFSSGLRQLSSHFNSQKFIIFFISISLLVTNC